LQNILLARITVTGNESCFEWNPERGLVNLIYSNLLRSFNKNINILYERLLYLLPCSYNFASLIRPPLPRPLLPSLPIIKGTLLPPSQLQEIIKLSFINFCLCIIPSLCSEIECCISSLSSQGISLLFDREAFL